LKPSSLWDHFHLLLDTIERPPQPGGRDIFPKQWLKDKLIEHRQYIHLHGADLPEICHWQSGAAQAVPVS
jgi:xylulose-5-phosphate/fructose-6-phosphate phosphoketolase